MNNGLRDKLVSNMLASPDRQTLANCACKMLDCYIDGDDVYFMSPLLSSKDPDVLSEAMWLLSEFGENSYPFKDKILSILDSAPTDATFWALSAGAQLLQPGDVLPFLLIISFMCSEDTALGGQSVNVLSELEDFGLFSNTLETIDKEHKFYYFISLLKNRADASEIMDLLQAREVVCKRQGLCLAIRQYDEVPEALSIATKNSDEDISHLASLHLRVKLG